MKQAHVAAILISLAIPAPVVGQAAQRLAFERYQLPNGLTVILAPDRSAPLVTVSVWYDVGSANEERGRSGFAHLFEHMMFQGSGHVQKREHTAFIQRAGGTVNGTTNEDRTNYFETLPSNRLNLGLWLEADRMRSLAITRENFENQREVVKEERRMRVDNQPYAPAIVDGVTMLFDSTTCFSYSHSVIGSMADLDAAKVEDVQAFFNAYYAPNHATLTVVGDFDPADTQRLVQQYFGDIPRGRETPRPACTVRLGGKAQARTWDDRLANLPAVVIMYPIPAHRDADTRPLQLLASMLGDGESSRLNRALVRDSKSAAQAGSQVDSRRQAGLFLTLAIANQGVSGDTLKIQLEAEIGRIVSGGVTEQELTKVKNSYRASNIMGRQTTLAVAEELQHYAHYHDTMDDAHADLDLYMRVTLADIQRVAAKYLTPANSLTLHVVPKPAGGAGRSGQ